MWVFPHWRWPVFLPVVCLNKYWHPTGDVLSREYLLTEVWDKYGLRGSNSNLNQYIILLRRALAGYGYDNLIITIPKMGFRLNTDIEIRCEPGIARQETVSNTDKTEALPAAPPIAETGPQPQQGKKRPSRFFWFTTLAGVVSASILLGALAYLKSYPEQREITPVKGVLENGCEITYLKDIGQDDRLAINKQVHEILSENKLRCDANRRVIFDNYTSNTAQNYGRTMLSFCQLGNHREIIACDNFYYYDWRIN